MPNTVCVCGHAKDAHEHYRRGTDCATCGAEVCPRFRRAILSRKQPPTPPARPPAEGAERDQAPHRSTFTATGPLAIVSDFSAFARRRPATS